MHFGRKGFPIGPEEEVTARTDNGIDGNGVLGELSEVIANEPAAQFDRLVTGVVEFEPGFAFARAIGEYGSVVFIAGNMPMKTEITPLLIITKLEQYQYSEATAIAVTMLLLSFALLLVINLLQWWTARHHHAA